MHISEKSCVGVGLGTTVGSQEVACLVSWKTPEPPKNNRRTNEEEHPVRAQTGGNVKAQCPHLGAHIDLMGLDLTPQDLRKYHPFTLTTYGGVSS